MTFRGISAAREREFRRNSTSLCLNKKKKMKNKKPTYSRNNAKIIQNVPKLAQKGLKEWPETIQKQKESDPPKTNK